MKDHTCCAFCGKTFCTEPEGEVCRMVSGDLVDLCEACWERLGDIEPPACLADVIVMMRETLDGWLSSALSDGLQEPRYGPEVSAAIQTGINDICLTLARLQRLDVGALENADIYRLCPSSGAPATIH